MVCCLSSSGARSAARSVTMIMFYIFLSNRCQLIQGNNFPVNLNAIHPVDECHRLSMRQNRRRVLRNYITAVPGGSMTWFTFFYEFRIPLRLIQGTRCRTIVPKAATNARLLRGAARKGRGVRGLLPFAVYLGGLFVGSRLGVVFELPCVVTNSLRHIVRELPVALPNVA